MTAVQAPVLTPKPTAEIRELLDMDANKVSPKQLELIAVEVLRCRQSFLHFLNYCKIDAPSTLTYVGGAAAFAFWPHLIETALALSTERMLAVLKARQIGLSWLLAAYSVWRCAFFPSTVGILMSLGEDEAVLLLAKAKFIDRHLPKNLRLSYDMKGKTNDGPQESYEFPMMHSSLTALPSTESAGVSRTASFIIADEWEKHPYAESNYAMARPAIADNGAQFIGCFTIDPFKATSLARTTWVDAQEGKNPFKALFFPYTCRPGRDTAWYENEKRMVPERELKGLTRDVYMRANYPLTAQEALSPIQSITPFDLENLDRMAEDLKNPIEVPGLLLDRTVCHIYKPHSIGNFYAAATDVAHGVGKDYSVTVVLNVKTGEVVADIVSNVIKDEDLTLQSVTLLNYYGSPKWWIENNDWGKAVINKAQELRYRNLGYENDQKKDKLGYHTADGPSRDAIWYNLIPAVNNRQVVIYSKYGLTQMRSIIRNVNKNGKVEAMSGANDDYAMALGIAYLKRVEVHAFSNPHAFDPLHSLHFAHEKIKEEESAFAPVSTLTRRW